MSPNLFDMIKFLIFSCYQLWKYTFNRLLVALAVFDLLFVVATVPIHTFHVFNYSNWFYAAIYSRSAGRSLPYNHKKNVWKLFRCVENLAKFQLNNNL